MRILALLSSLAAIRESSEYLLQANLSYMLHCLCGLNAVLPCSYLLNRNQAVVCQVAVSLSKQKLRSIALANEQTGTTFNLHNVHCSKLW